MAAPARGGSESPVLCKVKYFFETYRKSDKDALSIREQDVKESIIWRRLTGFGSSSMLESAPHRVSEITRTAFRHHCQIRYLAAAIKNRPRKYHSQLGRR